MIKTSKTIVIAAIVLASCMTGFCITSDCDAISEAHDYEDAKYWGLEKKMESAKEIIPRFSDIMPDVGIPLELETVDDVEEALQLFAELNGFEKENVALDFDIEIDGRILGERIDRNTLSLTSGASTLISVDLKIPQELITLLVDGRDKVDTKNASIMILDLTIDIHRHSTSIVMLNEEEEIIGLMKFAEKVIHVEGWTNFDLVDGKTLFLDEASNPFDLLTISTMKHDLQLIDGGFKFRPSGEADNGWEIDVKTFTNTLGTIHNEATGVAAKFLDLVEDLGYGDKDTRIINSETHSGIFRHHTGMETLDMTANVDRTGEIPIVVITNNAPVETHEYPSIFYEPLGFLFDEDNTLQNTPSIFKNNRILSEEKAKEFQDNIDTHIDKCHKHTKDVEVNMIFLESKEDVFNQTPLATKTVGYGAEVPFDVKAPEMEGFVQIGWKNIVGESSLYEYRPCIYADMYFVPSYAKLISSAPTAQDFEDTDIPLAWVHDMNDDGILIDIDLLKKHTTYMYVVGKNGDDIQYIWKVGGFGTEGTVGEIDFTLKPADAPAYAADKTAGREFVYLSANLNDNVSPMTSIQYYLGDKYEDGTYVDIYIDNGSSLTSAGNHMVQNNTVQIHGEKASGFLIVGSDAQPEPTPEPSKDKSGNNNTMLIIGAVIVAIIVAAIAVFLVKRNA